MDQQDVAIEGIYQKLKINKNITELEKDILSAIEVYIKQPFNKEDAKLKIKEIDMKYNTFNELACIMPLVSRCPLEQLDDVQVKENLRLRIIRLSIRQGKVIYDGKIEFRANENSGTIYGK